MTTGQLTLGGRSDLVERIYLFLEFPGEVLPWWKLFAVYRSLVVKPEAVTLGIRSEFILAGMTGQAQHPDKRIMENLRQRARQRFGGEVIRNADSM
jgi:hypothetical protein